MNAPVIPETYAQWRHCITVECRIPLTLSFVTQRLAVLRDERAQETVRFRGLYGDPHWKAVCQWFTRAQDELR
ncbi:hypothetical protein CAL29_24600 [Bordetella genomosp. 10]|uniref:Uncharacterized protein n=1 Tax=Bordetella genomosp. 10 TaxID=1416804 RepID=A0A261S2A6_9BORD|nr:hypothetical protein [Bordetella genomosp. 10]OZI31117.1 hypothetical protein CAL29_24600 [Bordetella genomosp. 10]